MHLAFLDEAGIDGKSASVTFGALVVPPGKFGRALMLHEIAVEQILPPESKGEFKRFHACDLYWGNKAFRKVKDEQRFTAIKVLLMAMRSEGLSFIYSSVNREEFYKSPLGTIRFAPLHFAFQMCLRGIEAWARSRHSIGRDPKLGTLIDWADGFLCIADESNNEEHKDEQKAVYRKLRPKRLLHGLDTNDRLFHAHDAMFFVDSVDSIGIQIADLCTYFVQRKLNGKEERQNFLDMFSDRIICAKPEPEWTQYRHLLRELDLSK